MKKILLTILFVLISSVVFAGDFDDIVVTASFSADSSDSALSRDTSWSDVLNISDWSGLSWNWLITDEANETNDTIMIYIQTCNTKAFSKFFTATSGAAVDTILIGAADTTRYTRKILPKDSLNNYMRFMAVHSIDLTGTQAQDSAGVERDWTIKFYCEDINR